MATYTATFIDESPIIPSAPREAILLTIGGSGSTPAPTFTYGQLWPQGFLYGAFSA